MKDLVFEVAKEQQEITSQLEKSLNSQNKSAKTLKRVNYFQRSLFDIADYAFKIPEFFTGELINKVNSLLIRAGEYLRGTLYEERALERPQEFISRVSSMIEAGIYKQCSACAVAMS